MPPQQVIIFIVGTIVILFGAYYVTYYVGMKATGQTRAGLRNRNISLLDRFAISRDKSFCIIEIAGKVYIVGVTNNAMTLLDTFDAAAFAKLTEDSSEPVPWNMTPVGQYGNKLTKKLVAFIASRSGKAPPTTGVRSETTDVRSGTTDVRTDVRSETTDVRSDTTGVSSGESGFSVSMREAERAASATDDGGKSATPDETQAKPPEKPEGD